MGAWKTIERNIATNGEKFRVTFYYPNEGKDTKTFSRLDEAKTALKNHKAAVQLNLAEKIDKKYTLDSYIDEYLSFAPIDESTVYGYRNFQRHFNEMGFAKLKISEIKVNDVKRYIKKRKETKLEKKENPSSTLNKHRVKNSSSVLDISKDKYLSNGSINKHIDFLHLIFQNAYENDLISSNIIDKIKHLKVDEKFKGTFYTKEEATLLLKKVQESNDFRIKYIVMIALFDGTRRGELAGLKWENVDFDNQTIYIENSRTQAGSKIIEKGTKTASSKRSIKITDDFKLLLIEYKKKQGELKEYFGKEYIDSEYILVDKKGKPIRPNYISALYVNFLKANNLKHIRLHDLRHTFASLSFQNGISVLEVSKALGHSDTRITQQVYTHVSENNNTNVVNKLEEIFK